MKRDDISKEITSIVAAIIEMEEDEIWEQRDKDFFRELELDSLLALEIIAIIEKKYKIEIEEELLEKVTSLNQTIELVISIINEQSMAEVQ